MSDNKARISERKKTDEFIISLSGALLVLFIPVLLQIENFSEEIQIDVILISREGGQKYSILV